MSSILKNKDILSRENKYFYFIPCYDIINNEIYFSEYFKEKIKRKKKIIIKKKIEQPEFNQCTTQVFKVGRILKKAKDKLRGKRSKTRTNNSKDSKKINLEDNNKKYLSNKDIKNYINDNKNIKEIAINDNIKKKEEKRKKYLKKEKLLLEEFSLNFKKMKIIS